MLPCDVGHKYDPRPVEEMAKMDAVIKQIMAEMPDQPAGKNAEL